MVTLIVSYIADLLFGDPERLYHPVRLIGKGIVFFERILRRRNASPGVDRMRGVALVLIVVGLTAAAGSGLIAIASAVHPACGFVLSVYIGWTTIAVKDLRGKAESVRGALRAGDLDGARKAVSKIVGRDTARLTEAKVSAAAIESVAENTNDGIVAPLFYFAIGGPVLALVYKAVNTLDSMVGYKTERYIDFGKCAARLDDAANYIPARLCGLLMCVASWTMGRGFRVPLRVMLRDGRIHDSPNSGISEAAMAGILRVKLSGPYAYGGEMIEKPTIGDGGNEVCAPMIADALRVSFIVSLMTVCLGVIVLWLR
ncbi:MAG TPA: adenosylcobinamide-phosphate synthase CbiB [bacterium]|nr:adenosylcobinamide-phosphate synthase CbiB [bacterium]